MLCIHMKMKINFDYLLFITFYWIVRISLLCFLLSTAEVGYTKTLITNYGSI